MDFHEQLQAIRSAGQVHAGWYLDQYPDVSAAGLPPAEHYLKYGAAMGRKPRAGFDTRFYLETYPDVAESGLNPLVHYVLHGRKEGRRTKPAIPSDDATEEKRVETVRHKLLSLGITHRAQSELRELVAKAATAQAQAQAAHELALWHMRGKTSKGYRTALEHIAEARALTDERERRSRLVTLELLCHLHLDQRDAARELFHGAGIEGLVSPDVLLAWANFFDSPEDRLLRMNIVLRRYGLPELALLPGSNLSAYDRLTSAAALPAITEGPKVTVLVAAFEAAGVIGIALRALQEQTWKNLEILVLDDASSDDTCAVVEAAAASDPRIRLLRMPGNGGAYVARNEGLDQATGDFVTLHDADDWAHPLRIEMQMRFMEENPEAMGCTTQQARADSGLGFTRWTGMGHFIIPNTSSFLFRREPMRENFGYWDTARFSADQELIRRMKKKFGRKAVVQIKSGPLAFQRDSTSSIVADDALGINGFLFGARKEYHDAQRHFHEHNADLRYDKDPARRRFPIPAIMRPDRHALSRRRHFPVIIASDFRMDGGSIESCIQEIRAAREAGYKVGLFEMYRYDLGDRTRRSMMPALRDEIDGEDVQVLTYGEEVSCDLLVIRYPPVLQNRQRYLPTVDAAQIKVVINQPPMSDYSKRGIRRYDLERCVKNIRYYFGKDAVWHPIGPLVRDALTTHHADQLHHVNLSDQDWHNIIDIKGWSRGARNRGSGDRLRIGRHSRDNWHKWPASAEDMLAAYPAHDDVEVHVLGGAKTPQAILGAIPDNWIVHDFGTKHPRDFLAGIDVWIYFAHPDWVESFGRTIVEAMAVGVPVILPEIYRPLFQDAALYATPQTAVEIARKLHADPAAYDAQAERARRYVAEQFSYEMHLERLQRAGVTADG